MKNQYLLIKLFLITLILVQCGSVNAQIESSVKHPDWSYNQSIYEVNLRQYTEEGTFKAFQEHLPRLKEIGANILWLMPIHPIGEKNRKGELGSYYSVKDYKGVNPEHGTLDDFKELVKAAHENGQYVILDWVANHSSWDNEIIVEHPEWFTKDSAGNFMAPVADWADVVDLDYNNKELRRYMIDALKYWVQECDIDGYRCDVAGMVPMDFWDEARAELDKIKPVFMLAEDESPEMHKAAFDMTYGWEMHHVFNDIAKGDKNAEDLRKLIEKEQKRYPRDAFRMRFTSNHDENTWNGTVFERLGESAAAMAVLSGIVPGMPLLYSGQEAGNEKRLRFFDKDTIEWKEHEFTELYTKLFNLKLVNKALWNGERGGEVKNIVSSRDTSVYAVVREQLTDKIFAIFNLSPHETDAELSGEAMAGDYTELFTGDKTSFETSAAIKLKPWEYKVFVK